MAIVKLSFLSPLALSVIFTADAFVVPALNLPTRALSPISRLYSENSDSKENDILNSPAFLKRKLEVIQSDISKVEAQIMNANTAIEEGKEIWGDKFAQLSQERKILQERMSKQSEELSDSATVEVVQKLLSVLDNYERAFGVIVPETNEQRAVEEDYKKSYQSIIDTFSELGVQKIKTVGEEFDYALHSAVMTRPGEALLGGMERLKAAWVTGKEWAGIARSNPARTMKLLSAASGALLIVGGISGVVNIFNPLGIVISIYNILFGLLIVATELKSWPIIGAFQKRVDVYFHLLSVPKGKGGFYLFIGLLTFCASDWGMASVCVMIVTIVGVLHLAGIPADLRTTSSMAGTDGAQHYQDSMEPLDAAASASISDFALKVIQDNPEMVKQGLNFVAANPGLVAGGSSAAPAAAPAASDRPPAYSAQDTV